MRNAYHTHRQLRNEDEKGVHWCYMMLHHAFVFCFSYTTRARHKTRDDHSALASSPPSALAFFFAFLLSRKGFVRSSFSSGSSSDFSDLTSSGLNHTGGCVISAGPPGRRAIVKWNAATNVFAGVKL